MRSIFLLICLLYVLAQTNAWRRRRRRRCSAANCQVGSWTSWSSCSHQCGTSGTQTRTRPQLQAAYCGGSCPYNLQETQACNRNNCQNGGTAHSGGCSCRVGYGGTCCEHDTNECTANNPCQNGAACVNLQGSYRCDCKSGYTGNNCETNINECEPAPCKYGGTCVDLVASYRCECAPGYVGLTCEEPDGVAVTCGDYKIEVSFEKAKFPLLNATRLHLLDSSCKGTENSTYLKVVTSLNDCGTTFTATGETLIFSNVVQDHAAVIDGLITREHDFDFSFNCSYSRKKFLSLHFVPEGRRYVPGKGGFGNLTFTFDVYPTESHKTPHANYPVEVTLNEYVYFGYSVQSSAHLGIMAVNCKATKDGSFYSSSPQYNFIQSGCGRDTTLRQDYNPNRSNQTFKIRAFRFFNNYDSFYIHCELLACHLNSANSKCSQGCVNGNRRKKRATTEEKISTSDPIILKRGPLKIIEKKSKDTTGGLSKQEAAAIIGGATAAGGFALVVVIVLAVLFVKYRIARLLLNRNKVGDLYATLDEQMSKRNAYIQEDDVIEKEDDMIEKSEEKEI